ncbi:MAG: HNH endonuclease [Mesorhizobium sp.]|nr:MAG: HNH endonuclease [Mesorhizobium sp.]
MVLPYWGGMPHGGERAYGGQPHFGVWNKADERFIVVNKGKSYKVAQLICEAFNGPRPAGAVCAHIDENSANNRPNNLEWSTQKRNLNSPAMKVYRDTPSIVGDPFEESLLFRAEEINNKAQEPETSR